MESSFLQGIYNRVESKQTCFSSQKKSSQSILTFFFIFLQSVMTDFFLNICTYLHIFKYRTHICVLFYTVCTNIFTILSYHKFNTICVKFWHIFVTVNLEIMTFKFWPFLRSLGSRALRIDPRVSGPRFSDSPWSYWP